ncbi:MAG: hypothetical protein Q9161_004832 [Pseudevernia consocians]
MAPSPSVIVLLTFLALSRRSTVLMIADEYMINVNLTSSWDWKKNISETASNITVDPSTGSLPPQVVRGTLYQGTQNDNSIYLYGGTTSYTNTSFPGWQPPYPSTYSLWSYNPGSTQWTQFDIGQYAPNRPSNGAAAEAVDQGLAFYFNGELDSGSSQGNGLITGTNVFLPMTEIDIFDVASIYNSSTPDGVWYKQSATNQNATDVPSPRVDFCLVVASAQDLSSHNIYMYGGRDGANPPNYFDEIWVLSLPAFTWTMIYSGISPRFAHTCHLVGNRTMLTVGGVAAASQIQGFYSANPPTCDWEMKGVGVYDMSDLVWGSVYNATAPVYEVPDPMISTIGGSRIGGATAKMPPSNFSQNGLARLFGVDLDNKTEAPSNTAHKRTAIIAGTVCGVVGLAIVVALVYYAAWRWRKSHKHPEEQVYEKDVCPDVHGGAVENIQSQPPHSTSEQPRQEGLL